jgi:hypothetical protein
MQCFKNAFSTNDKPTYFFVYKLRAAFVWLKASLQPLTFILNIFFFHIFYRQKFKRQRTISENSYLTGKYYLPSGSF